MLVFLLNPLQVLYAVYRNKWLNSISIFCVKRTNQWQHLTALGVCRVDVLTQLKYFLNFKGTMCLFYYKLLLFSVWLWLNLGSCYESVNLGASHHDTNKVSTSKKKRLVCERVLYVKRDQHLSAVFFRLQHQQLLQLYSICCCFQIFCIYTLLSCCSVSYLGQVFVFSLQSFYTESCVALIKVNMMFLSSPGFY